MSKWASIIEVDGAKPNAQTVPEQPASSRPGASNQKSELNGKAGLIKSTAGKKSQAQPSDKRPSATPQASKPAVSAFGGGGFGSMFGKPGASRTARPVEHAPSTMRMNPLPRPEVGDHDDDGGDRGARTAPPRSLPSQPQAAKLTPLALPDSKRSAPAPPPAKSEAPVSNKPVSAPSATGGMPAVGSKRPLDTLRLPVPQAPGPAGPGAVPTATPAIGEREDRPGGTKRRRRGNGPLSVSWASQLTDVREYVPNPEEWGKSPRHLHGDEFSDAVSAV